MQKVYGSAAEALDGLLSDGMFIAAGGFGLCGIPELLIDAIVDSGTKDLTIASNNCGVDGFGLGKLLDTRQIKKMLSSYVGENAEFMRQYLSGELELEFNPQGTLAERMRAAGAGIPAFFTPTGAKTLLTKGKEIRDYNGLPHVLEEALYGDVALVEAWEADRWGNLTYRDAGRNFNPVCATAAKLTIAQTQHVRDLGELNPEHIVTPGIFVDRVVHIPCGAPVG